MNLRDAQTQSQRERLIQRYSNGDEPDEILSNTTYLEITRKLKKHPHVSAKGNFHNQITVNSHTPQTHIKKKDVATSTSDGKFYDTDRRVKMAPPTKALRRPGRRRQQTTNTKPQQLGEHLI